MQVREEDLTVLVGEAATFMEKERARASKRARRHRDARTRSALPSMLLNALGTALLYGPIMGANCSELID